MPFFTLLTAIVTYYAVKNKSKKLFLLVGALFGILLQLHYLELFFMVSVVSFIAFAFLWKTKSLSLALKT